MKRPARKILIVLAYLALALGLCGCSLETSAENLFTLPQVPVEYTGLANTLNTYLESGYEYITPSSGNNIQSLQMIDMDGDGEKEAVAFFRHTADDNPLKILFFREENGTFSLYSTIESGGSSIDSVSFRDFNGDGRLEVVVGWRVSMDLQALAVYSLEPDGARELMRTNYVKYAVADLNKDGKRELTVLRANQDGEGVADCYVSKNGALTLRSSVLVSMTMAELSQQGKVTVGTLRSSDPALFITGVADGVRAITDVLALRGGELTNLVLSAITGVSGEVSRFCSVYPMDINGDGVTEVPRTVTLQGEDADHAVSQRVDWISYDASGTASRVLSTYHDVADGWYLQLPEGWPERVWVGRSASPDEIGITFYTDSSREESYVPVLRITALSGSERERLAVRTGRFILGRNDGVIYVGELLKGNQDWKYNVTEDEVRASFSLIGTEWSAGDN